MRRRSSGFARTVGVSSIRASNIRAIAIMTNAVETNRVRPVPPSPGLSLTCSVRLAPHIQLRDFFSSITAHVAAAVIPPSATSSKISSGVPIGVISATRVRPLARIQVRSVLPGFFFWLSVQRRLGRLCRGAPHGRLSSVVNSSTPGRLLAHWQINRGCRTSPLLGRLAHVRGLVHLRQRFAR